MSSAALVAAAKTYRAHHLTLRNEAQRHVGQAWTDLGGLTATDLAAFRPVAVRIVQAARLKQVDLMAAYTAHTRALAFHRPHPTPVALDRRALLANYRGGVDIESVYERPVVAARTAISNGKTFGEAMQLALVRATGLADADVLMMQRDSMSAAIESDAGVPDGESVVGYQRTLGDGGASGICGLCITASTQTYRSGDLEPIHLNCTCGVAEVYGNANPGHVINQGVLSQIQSLASDEYGSGRSSLSGTRFSIDESGDLTRVDKQPLAVETHGELGPVMVDADHSFTGPADLQAA